MTSNGAENMVRYALSDATGTLRFTSFEVTGGVPCEDAMRELRDYMVGRALDDVDMDHVAHIACPGMEGCCERVAEVLEEHRARFTGRTPSPRGAIGEQSR